MLGLNLTLSSGRGLPFNPSQLFRAGEQGVWYDPSDLSTLFQDAAGTLPVTSVEQPVGLMLDKSGCGFHAKQATATSRPVLRQDGNGKHYLYFDGVDDWLVTPTITPGVDKVQVFAGVRFVMLSLTSSVVELSQNVSTNDGSFFLYGENNQTQRFWSKGTKLSRASGSAVEPPITSVMTGLGDISGDSAIIRTNGTQAEGRTDDQGTGNYLAYPLYIGRRAGTTFPLNGHLYSLIVRFGPNLPIGTIEQVEAWINGKTGAY